MKLGAEALVAMAAIQGVLEEIGQDAYEYYQSPIKR
jgi:hypothetical protein